MPSQLTRRTQILLDDERHARLAAEARSRGTSIAELIRAAIDRSFPETSAERRRAVAELLRLADEDPLPVTTPEDLKREIVSASDRLDGLASPRA